MKNYDVAIIGGGAAGTTLAVRLSEKDKNLKIALIEPSARLCKKLAATGNGQGNVSNADLSGGHYFGGNVALAEKIVKKEFSLEELFGCIFTADGKGRIYPASRQASSLGDCLIRKINKLGVEVINDRAVCLEKGFTVSLSGGEKLRARFVALCVGGKAQKQFGTDGTGYSLVLPFGHKVTPLFPSLVQLKTETEHIKNLKGIRADCLVTAFAGGKKLKSERGDVIFTDYGVSGNAVFELSPYVTDKKDAFLSLEFLPDLSAEKIDKNLSERQKNGEAYENLLSGTLHNQIARAILKRAGGDVEKIVSTLKNFVLPVTGTLGFDYAQVTRGGIDTSGVTDELESKFVKNLFFAGEVLDVDGNCGGYNLQWAFSSAYTVAEAILKR